MLRSNLMENLLCTLVVIAVTALLTRVRICSPSMSGGSSSGLISSIFWARNKQGYNGIICTHIFMMCMTHQYIMEERNNQHVYDEKCACMCVHVCLCAPSSLQLSFIIKLCLIPHYKHTKMSLFTQVLGSVCGFHCF